MSPMLAAMLRHILGFGAGLLAYRGVEVDSATMEAVASGAMALASIGWSLWDKRGR